MSFNPARHIARLAVAAILAGGFAAGSALADQTYNIGPLTSTAYSNAPTVGVGSFVDTYNFSIGDLIMVSSAVKLDLGFTFAPDLLHIDNLTMSLFDSSNNQLAMQTGSPVSMQEALSAGNYYVTISGNADGSQGGLYQFAIAAVPEPGTWALLLSGLGLLGFMARRRVGTTEQDLAAG